MTISEISLALDKAIVDISKKKLDLDSALAAHEKAAADHHNALNHALKLRNDLDIELNKIMPSPIVNRVR